jgi:hypothetical protein
MIHVDEKHFLDHSIELFRKGGEGASKEELSIPVVKLFYVSLVVFCDLR